MKTTVYCIVSDKGQHSFYMKQGNSKYYLFTQNYRKSVQRYYGKGVTIEEAINFNRSKHDSAIINTMDKLPSYIKYIEKEYQITVLKKTKQKQDKVIRRDIDDDYRNVQEYYFAYTGQLCTA